MIELIRSKSCLIFGCGNLLFGDDGFGPQVIEHLQNKYRLPEYAGCIDVGTSIREILFDILLLPENTEQIIIIDLAEQDNRLPGEIFEIDVDHINHKKVSDFSLHQFPTTNMLKELRDHTKIKINILVAQTSGLPDEVRPGLSEPVWAAVPDMCRKVIETIV